MKQLTDKQLIVRITGAVQSSNLAEFEKTALTVIDSINTDLRTDDDFAQAEQDIKDFGLIETRLEQVKLDILNGVASISEQVDIANRLLIKSREKRLYLSKQVNAEKEKRKNEIIAEARRGLELAVSNSPVRHGFAINFKALQDAIKGKRFISKMREAITDVIESELNALKKLEDVFAINTASIELSEKEYPGLFPDKKKLALSSLDVVAAMIESRVMKFKFEVAEKERKEKEEQQAAQITQEPEIIPQDSAWQPDEAPPLPPDPFTDWTPPQPPSAPQTSTRYTIAVQADTADIDTVLEQIKAIAGVRSAMVVEGD